MQTNTLLLSDRITSGGVGGGIGLQYDIKPWLAGQVDFSSLWLLGQSYSARVAVGYQRDSVWAGAAWISIGCLWGDRMEFLSDEGTRPASPTLTAGVRLSPLRFRSASAFVSLLEPSVGVAPYDGLHYEVTILQLGGALW